MIAVPFLVLGAWCLVDPGTVERLSLTPEHRIDTFASRVLLGCFGAQALISGLFAAASRFTRLTFLAYGVALLPFFWFNVHFTVILPVFSPIMLVDAVANVFMLACCVAGWRALDAADRRPTNWWGRQITRSPIEYGRSGRQEAVRCVAPGRQAREESAIRTIQHG